MSAPARLACLGLAVLLAAAPCARPASAAETKGSCTASPQRVCEGCSLVLIVLDAARADHFGCYGYSRPTTPHIDLLARESVVFDRASSEASYTIASIGSLLTGLPPWDHGVLSALTSLEPAVETLAERLRAAGYRTAAFTENPLVAPARGFDRGFERFQVYRDMAQGDWRLSHSRELVAQAVEWAGEPGGDRPYFLYVHLLRPHNPYVALPEHQGAFRRPYDGPLRGKTRDLVRIQKGKHVPTERDLEHLRDLYDENLLSADALVGSLLDGLRTSGRLDSTVILLVADHGEAFLEHGQVLHGYEVFEESIHIPFLVRVPGDRGVRPGRRNALVQLADVMPTSLSLLGLSPAAPLPSFDLVPLLCSQDAPPPRETAISQTYPVIDFSVREGSIKLIERYPAWEMGPPKGLLFDLEEDPRERKDIASDRGQERVRLGGILADVIARERAKIEGTPAEAPSKQTTEALRALGYVE